MKRMLLLGLALCASGALAQSCPVQVKATAKLKDPNRVAYTVVMSNPTAKALTVNMRMDFFFKGQKLAGGFETLTGTIPARGKKTFSGTETFIDKLKGADAAKVTKIRKCG